MSDYRKQYSADRVATAERYMKRAGYPTGNDVQALGPKPEFSKAQKFVNESSWDEVTPPKD